MVSDKRNKAVESAAKTHAPKGNDKMEGGGDEAGDLGGKLESNAPYVAVGALDAYFCLGGKKKYGSARDSEMPHLRTKRWVGKKRMEGSFCCIIIK